MIIGKHQKYTPPHPAKTHVPSDDVEQNCSLLPESPCVSRAPTPGAAGRHQLPRPRTTTDALPPVLLPRPGAAVSSAQLLLCPTEVGHRMAALRPGLEGSGPRRGTEATYSSPNPHQLHPSLANGKPGSPKLNPTCTPPTLSPSTSTSLHRQGSGERRQQPCPCGQPHKAAEKAEPSLHAARVWAAISVPGLSHQIDPAVSVRQAYTRRENHLQDGKHYF